MKTSKIKRNRREKFGENPENHRKIDHPLSDRALPLKASRVEGRRHLRSTSIRNLRCPEHTAANCVSQGIPEHAAATHEHASMDPCGCCGVHAKFNVLVWFKKKDAKYLSLITLFLIKVSFSAKIFFSDY